MAGLIAVLAVLAALALGVYVLVQRRRLNRLAESAEDFLVNHGEPLAFSVREDSLAPLHNAVAELENSLLLARDRQTQDAQTTQNMTADISHQLKTPLASLRLFCEMDAAPHMAQQLEQIDRMERLIQALLRLERLCADGYEFTFATHDVSEIIRLRWANLSPGFPKCRLEIAGSASLRCDREWLGEAFANLMKNACEHMPQGGKVTVNLETTETAFFCTLEDEGGGVTKEELPRLFQRFYRAAGTDSRGAGLGLAIVREIIWRHHGTIYAENTSKGLKMCISIPMQQLIRS